MKNKISLFLSAFIQVFLVACNVTFISKGRVVPMLIVGFLISITWSFNVKKVAFGSNWDRVIYAIGACIGTYFGYLFSHSI